MPTFVPFSDGLFSTLLDDKRVGGTNGLADFAAKLHEDVQEANAAVRMRWFDLWLKMGAEFDERQKSDDDNDFTPDELQQRMVGAVLEEIAYDPDVAEKFLTTAIKSLMQLPNSNERLSALEQMISATKQGLIDG